MNRTKCQEIVGAFREKARYYQGIQHERDLTVEELKSMKKEYLNFTRGLLQALNEKERQDIDLNGVKRIFRNSGLKKEELSDEELDDLIRSASSDKIIDVSATVEEVPYSRTRTHTKEPTRRNLAYHIVGYAAMAVIGFFIGTRYSPNTQAPNKAVLSSIEHYVVDNNQEIKALRADIMKIAQIGDILELKKKYDSALETIKDKTESMENLAQRIQRLEAQYQTAQTTIGEKDKTLEEQQKRLAELDRIRTEYLRKVFGIKGDIQSIIEELEQGVEKLGEKSEELKP